MRIALARCTVALSSRGRTALRCHCQAVLPTTTTGRSRWGSSAGTIWRHVGRRPCWRCVSPPTHPPPATLPEARAGTGRAKAKDLARVLRMLPSLLEARSGLQDSAHRGVSRPRMEAGSQDFRQDAPFLSFLLFSRPSSSSLSSLPGCPRSIPTHQGGCFFLLLPACGCPQ